MSLSYEPLWKMLSNMNISKMEFAKMIGMSNATLAKLSKNEPITLTTVDKICNQFNCPIENVVKHIQDFQNYESIFTTGTIISANDLAEIKSDNFRLRKRLYVVLDIEYASQENNSKKTIYKIAPIYKISIPRKEDALTICFKDVDIDGKSTNGYISLKEIQKIPSGNFEKRMGVMPQKYMQLIPKQ